MSERRLAGPLGLSALIAAAFYAYAPPAMPRVTTATLREPSPAGDDRADSPLAVLNEFLGRDKSGSAQTTPGRNYRVRFVVATLPDPVDSHFASLFDRGLEAIVSAMSDSGYDLDRWSLPWHIPGPRELQAAWKTNNRGDLEISAGPPTANDHRTQPGAVLFRKGEDLLVLFLVGESPTRGLQKSALIQALNTIHGYDAMGSFETTVTRPTLSILGPYFSGTAESLHVVLSSQRLDRPVRVLSGSATSGTNRSALGLSSPSSYESTVHPDEAMAEVLRDFFRSIRVTPSEEVALLVENGTSYGNGFGEAYPSGAASVLRPKLVMRFPLQISQIRSAHEKLDATRRESARLPAPRRALEMSLEGPDAPRDALSPYDSRMTANAAELVLSNVFDTVRRQKIRYLGLVASDTRDVLFLARKAREYGADTHLFTFGVDILYQHPDVLPSLTGLLAVTTYPLLGPYQAWHDPGRHRPRTFSGSSEEGIYNAMLFLIGEEKHALDYASPTETADPPCDHRPPVWIVVNGHHGFWPVAVKPVPDLRLMPAGADPTERADPWPALPIPNAARILFLAWSVGTGLFVFGHGCYRPSRSSSDGKCRTSAATGEPPGVGAVRDRLRAFFAACEGESHILMNHAAMAELSLVLATMEGALTALLIVWERTALLIEWERNGDRDWPSLLLVGFVMIVGLPLTGAAAWMSARELCYLFRARRLLKVGQVGAASDLGSTTDVRLAFNFNFAILIAYAVVGALGAYVTLRLVLRPPQEAFLILSRSFDLASRVGPLMPLCLGMLVLALFAMGQVRRSILYEEQRFRAPAGRPSDSLVALFKPYATFTRLIRNPFTSPLPSLASIVGLVLFYSLFVGAGWLESFDGPAWGILSTLLVLLCGWCVSWSVLEFCEIWRRLSALLRVLSWSPLADAFNRMPDGLARSQWRMWRSAPTLTALHVSVSYLKTLVRLGRLPEINARHPLGLVVISAQARADSIFATVLDGANRGSSSTQSERKRLRTQLACAAMGVSRLLERAWLSWPSKADIADKSDKSERDHETLNTVVWLRRQVPGPPDVFVRIAEEYVAVRFVAFIHYAVAHMRNVLSLALAGFVLLMTLVTCYPVQPLRPLVGIAWVLGLLGIGAVVWTFVDMDRDVILSYIAKTKPGHVNFGLELATNLVVYGVVPLLTLLATQFPGLADGLLSVLAPVMRTR
jgi:hypothetical protein